MPNGKVHAGAGIVSGAGFALARSAGEPGSCPPLEALGGAVGGYLGGKLPDWIEPGISSWHRGRAHSVTAGAVIVGLGRDYLTSWENWCRSEAENVRLARMELPQGSGQAIILTVYETVLRVLAGLLGGILAGYISHLWLDAGTPRGICFI